MSSIAMMAAPFIRRATSSLIFRKRLPKDLGSIPIFVTPRADLRVLYPGLERAGRDLMIVARTFVKPGNVVWDLGSNQGIFATCASHMAGPSGRVFAVEPDPKYAAMQQRTFDALPTDRCAPTQVLAAAISDRVSIQTFNISAKGHTTSHLAKHSIGSPFVSTKTVPTFPLDFLLDYWPAPNFIKVDVEGAVLDMIAGGPRMFSEVRPTLYIEIDPPDQPALIAKGYSLLKMARDGSLTKPAMPMAELIAVPD